MNIKWVGILTKELLEREYLDNNKSAKTIAKEIGCSKQSVLRALKRYGIERREILKDLTGKRFGLLTVIKFAEYDKFGRSKWWCKCDSGPELIVSSTRLIEGITKSCGCLKNRKGKSNPRWIGTENISGSLWYRINKNAKRRKIPVKVSLDDIDRLLASQDYRCALSGLSIECLSKQPSGSLDRIDCSEPYTISNLQWTHKDINVMRMNLTVDRFIYLCRLIQKRKDFNVSKCFPTKKQVNHCPLKLARKWYYTDNISSLVWYRIVNGARSRGYDLKVDLRMLDRLLVNQKFKCMFTGLSIQCSKQKFTASLDRIDNNLGYIPDNIQWVHKDINLMKQDFDQKYFISLCRKVARWQDANNS